MDWGQTQGDRNRDKHYDKTALTKIAALRFCVEWALHGTTRSTDLHAIWAPLFGSRKQHDGIDPKRGLHQLPSRKKAGIAGLSLLL
jgi:hypothetical protein